MTTLQATAYLAEVLAGVFAILLARRHAAHRPAAVALSVQAAANVLDALIVAALHPLPRPVEGAARALVYLDGAINLGNYAVVAGLAVALAVSLERRRFATGIVAGVWLLASVVLAVLYPSPMVRGDGLQRVYFGADLIGLCVSTIALVTWARAGIAAKRSPDGVHVLAIALVAFDAALLLAPFSPWRSVLFGAPYAGYQLATTAFFAIVTIAEVIAWKVSSPG